MTSKNLFYKMMKENMKQRLWSVALISLIFFFVFPVQTALSISSYLDPEQWDGALRQAEALEMAEERLRDYFIRWCSIESGMLIFLMLLFAVVCAVSGFSYLHSRKKTDFYHSIPIQREKLFGVVCLNGILFVAVPYLLGTVISAVMIQVKTGSGACWGPVMMGYLLHMAFYFMIYATVVAAVILTGNIVVSLLGALVFFLWGPSVAALSLAYYSSYFTTFYDGGNQFENLLTHSSPAAWYISATASENPGQMALWAVLAGALIMAAAVMLYRVRPSESAGRAMAFKKSQPLIKCLIVVPSALLGSLLFHEMMRKDSWSLFGLICGLLISYAIIEIIYHFDFKRLFDHKYQLLFCGIFAGAIMAFFRFDLSGYDSYLPSETRLETAGIYCYRLDSDVSDQYQAEPSLQHNTEGTYHYIRWSYKPVREVAEGMTLSDKEAVFAIAERGIEDAQAMRKKKFSSRMWNRHFQSEGDEDFYGDILVAYHLKNGKTVLRNYSMNLSAVRASLDQVYGNEEYKEAIYPVLEYQPDEIAGINYQEYQDFRHVPLKNEEVKKALLSAYQEELRSLTAEDRRKENPVGAIQFKTNEMQEMITFLRENNGNYADFNNHLYFPIYPSFTETISLLNQCGMKVGQTLTADKVEKIILDYSGTYPEDLEEQEIGAESVQTIHRGDTGWSVTLTDKDEIREVLESASDNELNGTNYLNESYSGIQITAFVPTSGWEELSSEDGFSPEEPDASEAEAQSADVEAGYPNEYITYGLRFEYAKVPDFVKQKFHLSDDLMQHDKVKSY